MKVRDLILTCESFLTVHVCNRIFEESEVLKTPREIMEKEVETWSFSAGNLFINTEESEG